MAKKKAEAHHGGAWKVAYADFVTALMALFMVLWISSQDKEILIAVSQYFQSPFNSPMDNTNGVLPFNSNATPRNNSDDGGASGGAAEKPMNTSVLQALAQELYKALSISQNDSQAPVRVEITSDGLRVTVFDRTDQPIFQRDTTQFTEWGNLLIQNLAWLIDRQSFNVVVEGHTRQGMKMDSPDYSEWDLSTDQANAVRRALSYYAVDPARFQRVSGYGSTQPLKDVDAGDEANQRITLSLSLVPKSTLTPTPKKKEPEAIPSEKTPFGEKSPQTHSAP